MKPATTVNDNSSNHRDKIQTVLTHIDENLDSTLNVDELSQLAGLSKFHFHRQFSAFMGINLYKLVQLKRLRRAAQQLVFRDDSILNIALHAGFESAEAFSRAFKLEFSQSPSQFRHEPQRKPWLETDVIKQIESPTKLKVEIVDRPAIRVWVLHHHGPMSTFYKTLQCFIQWRKQNRLPPSRSRTYNLLHEFAQGECQMSVAVALPDTLLDDDVAANNDLGVSADTIKAGCYAMLRHIGSWDSLETSLDRLFSQWLPDSGYQMAEADVVLERINFLPDTPENQLITDIYLPVAPSNTC